ncbi:MAG: DUF4388 domain-containing protein [Nitrospirae bacterium]|nr:DUF4388 domain-containing protein [Nitrospirota bacterium]
MPEVLERLDSRYKRLKDYRFPEILMSLGASGKTGTLYLKNWPVEKIIYLKEGKVIFASSNIEDDCLGINLLTRAKITVVQYYESIRLLEKTGKRHGSILVELGYLAHKELEDAVNKQVEDIVLSVFKWEDGYFFFEEVSFDLNEPITLKSDIATLIYKGIKKMDSFPQIRNALPLTTILTLAPASGKLLKKFKFEDTDKKIINLIDGKNAVLDILTRLSGDDLETIKVLYALNCIGAAVPAGHSNSNKEMILNAISEISTPEALYKKGTELFINRKYTASATAFREAASISPDKAMYHFYLAMSLINTSMYKEAEDALVRAIELEPFNEDYYTELGIIYIKQGFGEKAAKTFEFALRINPHNERAQTSLSNMKK